MKLFNEDDLLWEEKLSSVKVNSIDENICQLELITDTNLKLKIIALISEENYNETETQISQRQKIQFSTEKKHIMTYKNKIDKRANKLVEPDIKQLKIDHDQAKRIAALRKKDSTNIYYFFKNATDYAFARWFH